MGAPQWDESGQSLKPGGHLVITGTTTGGGQLQPFGAPESHPHSDGSRGPQRGGFAALLHMVHDGRLRGVVGQTFDLADTAKTHQVIAGRDSFGKPVLRVP